MATRTIALTVLSQTYAPEVVATTNRECATLRMLSIRLDGNGQNCGWVIKGSGATGAAMAEGATAGTPANDARYPAVLNWAYYKGDGGVTGPAQAAAINSHSPEGDREALAADIHDTVAATCSTINGHLFTGDPTASPVQVGGYDYALGSTTNTYATINRTSVAAARPGLLANPGAATPVTFEMLRKDISDIKVASGQSPNLAPCHPDVWNKIAGLYDANRQYIQMVREVSVPGRGKIVLDASVDALVISGCMFYPDKDATLESGNTSGRIYYLNSRFVDVAVQPTREMLQILAANGISPGRPRTANDGFGDLPMLFTIDDIAKTGDADLFMAKVYLQQRIRSPKHCGMRRYVAL